MPVIRGPSASSPVLGKILDRLLTDRIVWHLEKNNFFHPNQFGFCKGKNTIQAIQNALNFIKDSKPKKQHIAIISIDYKGTFNHAWRQTALYELKQQNCPRNIYRLLYNYFENRKTGVYANSCQVTINNNGGCPQGSCSGPALWNIIYNGLLNINVGPNQNCLLQGFADDTLLLVCHHNRNIL